MYVYFDRSGNLKEIIYEPVREGDLYKQTIYVYWDNHPTPVNSFSAKIKYSDNTYGNVELLSTSTTTAKIPYNQDRDLKWFEYNKNYAFFSFTPASSFPSGLTQISFYFTAGGSITNGVLIGATTHAMQILPFNVDDSVNLVGGNNINESQWSALLSYLRMSNVRAFSSIPTYLQLENIGTGGVFINTTTNKYYKINNDYTYTEIPIGTTYISGNNIGIVDNAINVVDDPEFSELTVDNININGNTISNVSEDINITTISGKKLKYNGDEVQTKIGAGTGIEIDDNEISVDFTEVPKKDETAYSMDINSTTYVISLKNKNGTVLSTVDLPLESVVVNGSYDSVNKKVILTLQNGSTIQFSVADLVSGLQPTLVSGTNIKTINGNSIVGGGNLDIKSYKHLIYARITNCNVVGQQGTSDIDCYFVCYNNSSDPIDTFPTYRVDEPDLTERKKAWTFTSGDFNAGAYILASGQVKSNLFVASAVKDSDGTLVGVKSTQSSVFSIISDTVEAI